MTNVTQGMIPSASRGTHRIDLHETNEGEDARQLLAPLPGACDWPELEDRAVKDEVWATSLNDPGGDRYEVVAFDVGGEEIEGN